MIRDVIILGSGCAGSTAAIYTARANLSPLVLEGREPGGQLTLTTEVENYPGFPSGIQGPELVELMRKQAERFGAVYLRGDRHRAWTCRSVPSPSRRRRTRTRARTLIVATGASARLLGLESEKKLMGRGRVHLRHLRRGVLPEPGDRRGRRAATPPSRRRSSSPGSPRRCSSSIAATSSAHRRSSSTVAGNNPKIEFVLNTVVADILDPGKNEVSAIRLKSTRNCSETVRKVDGVFVAIGHDPNTKVFEGQLALDNGYIVLREGAKTSVDGVFAAGDVHDTVYRQAVTAAGAGCRAAIEVERFLETEGR